MEQSPLFPGLAIAVFIPCFNEEVAIAHVVQGFRKSLPSARIYVYDNNSTDRTKERALAAGAIVRHEVLQGKGNVVRRMFSDVDADVYVLVDGDQTYDPGTAPQMVSLLLNETLDMVNGRRVTEIVAAYRRGHRIGNFLLTGSVRVIFGDRIRDMLSGYRVLSRRFVKSFPVISSGFEIETELTIHALELCMPVGEVDTPYRDRPEGSTSKLRTYRDGINIATTIVTLIKEVRPLQFFWALSAIIFFIALGLGFPLVLEYHRIHLVPRLPTAVLCTGLMLIAVLAAFFGLILDSVAKGRRETKRLRYLSIPATNNVG